MLTEALSRHESDWMLGQGAMLTLQETIKDIQDARVDKWSRKQEASFCNFTGEKQSKWIV